jgi:RNA polymerase sigma factor (TIGR02999 family)
LSQPPSSGITELLRDWATGDGGAFDRIMELAYPELRKIAGRCLRNERPGHTIQTTALVNEACLRLVDIRQMRWQDRAHFFAVGARIMRRILVDYARARGRAKREPDGERVDFTGSLVVSREVDPGLTRLDDALVALEKFDSRKARVVEMRYFGGLQATEIAAVLGVSRQTVHLDWTLAKAWLAREMAGKESRPSEQRGSATVGSN